MLNRIMHLKVNIEENALYKYFKQLRTKDMTPATSDIVLVQCVEDETYFGLFGQLILSLREHKKFRVELYVLRSLRVGEGNSFLSLMVSRLLFNPLLNFKWIRLYGSFCDSVGYKNTGFQPISDTLDAYLAWKCWRDLSDKNSLLKVKIDDVLVGDLINDSYLRFSPRPSVELKDKYLYVLIWQAHRNLRRAKKYFVKIQPRFYITSYCTYIQHGIPVRVAVHKGVKVFSLGNAQEFVKKLSLNDCFQPKKTEHYFEEFNLLDDKEAKISLAEKKLSFRLNGNIDASISSMKKSAYIDSGGLVPDVRDAVVIFLHDFYDSPHIYGEMVFPDFWEWICFTIETLSKENIKFYVKPHPNQVGDSRAVLCDLKQRYPRLSFISTDISNVQLVNKGMACAVTVYGTVAHEMAYLGIPIIACGKHPHIAFDFCKTAIDLVEYKTLLKNALVMSYDKLEMKRQSLIFYYMHNLNVNDEYSALKDAYIEYSIMSRNITLGKLKLVDKLVELSQMPAYKEQVTYMLNELSL